MAHSLIKRYRHTDSRGNSVVIPYLYIDESTGTFLVRLYHGGAVKSRSLKTTNFTVAKTRITAALDEIRQAKKKIKSNKLVRDYYVSFIKSLEGDDLSKATMTRYSVSWRHHVEPFWGNLAPEQINQDTYSDYLAWFKGRDGGKIFNHLKLVRGLLKHMSKSGALFSGPVDAFLPKKEADSNKESKGTYIEAREVKAILEAASLNDRDRLMIEMAHVFGFRLGELCNLKSDRCKKVGEHTVEVRLQSQDTKTRTARTVPLTANLSKRLLEIMKAKPGMYVFAAERNRNKPVSKQVIDRVWAEAKAESGIRRRMRFHDLRHTAATNFADMGIDPVKACAILGMTLKIYMGTYVKRQSLNLSSVLDVIESKRGDA